MDDIVTVHSLYAEATLPDTTPVNPPMTYDGATVTEIDVPSGVFVITDLILSLGFVYWVIEVDFGSGFVSFATFGFTLLSPASSEKKHFKSPLVIQGGPGVKIRLLCFLAATPTSPVDVNATLRCYTRTSVAGPTPSPIFSTRQSMVITLSDLATTGSVEEILNMTENGGTAALSLPVAAGTILEIDDVDVAAGGNLGIFKLQQTNDGVSWFNIGALDVSGFGIGTSLMVSPNTPWRVRGDDGVSVAFRVAITTPSGSLPVASVLSGYRLS